MKKHKTPVQAACLGVMQNLSLTSDFHQRLLAQGVLEALDSSKDVDGGALSAQCAAVLYNFSLHDKSITQMMDLGGIFLVTHLSYSNVVKVSRNSAGWQPAGIHVPNRVVMQRTHRLTNFASLGHTFRFQQKHDRCVAIYSYLGLDNVIWCPICFAMIR